jgi:hypothetical protein
MYLVAGPQDHIVQSSMLRHGGHRDRTAVSNISRVNRLPVARKPGSDDRPYPIRADNSLGFKLSTIPANRNVNVPTFHDIKNVASSVEGDSRHRTACIEERTMQIGAVHHDVWIIVPFLELAAEIEFGDLISVMNVAHRKTVGKDCRSVHLIQAGPHLAELRRLLKHRHGASNPR